MKIAVIGATGMVGSRVTAEAVARGHRVTAVSRRPAADDARLRAATHLVADASEPAGARAALDGAEAAVVSVRPAAGAEHALPTTTRTLLDAAAATGTRLLVVGGAGPLRAPGARARLVVDDRAHVPLAWRAVAAASVAQLRVCEAHPTARWAYLSPPAMLEPGERTGAYRRGTDTLLTLPDGSSRISAEDLAVAVLDALEQPGTAGHFTVGW